VAMVVRAVVVKVAEDRAVAVKVAEDRAAATNPVLAPQAAVCAQVVGTKKCMWLASVALTVTVLNVGQK